MNVDRFTGVTLVGVEEEPEALDAQNNGHRTAAHPYRPIRARNSPYTSGLMPKGVWSISASSADVLACGVKSVRVSLAGELGGDRWRFGDDRQLSPCVNSPMPR